MSLIRNVRSIDLIVTGDAMKLVAQKALAAARGDAHVLITGERGSGKAALARYIHHNSHRSDGRLAAVTCEGLPDLLLQSELFGHKSHSFPGAYSDKPGALKSAAGGTVLLAEIDALSLDMQYRLLRWLETGKSVRFGDERLEFRNHVRLISTTTVDLQPRIADGLFLAQLYGRLNEVSLAVPPLRERRDDIPSLVDHFANHFAGPARAGHRAQLSREVRDALCRAEWPGNVQQLKAAVLRQLLIDSVAS